MLTDASDSDKLGFVGFAASSVSASDDVDINISGADDNQSSLSPGTVYYLQDTAGDIGTSPGSNSVIVGRALTTTDIQIKPNIS